MATTDTRKNARIEARTTEDRKAYFRRAATLRGMSFSQFVEQTLEAAAKRAHLDQERELLSKEDSLRFAEALASDEGPNDALKAAATRYKKRKKG